MSRRQLRNSFSFFIIAARASSITNIGAQAFSGCNNLTDVYYSGTKEQWEEIAIGNGNEPLTSAIIHYHESPPPTPPSDEITFRCDSDFTVNVGDETTILASIPNTRGLQQGDIVRFLLVLL